ncbi:flagellin lysine-N-methylase [Shewanella gaetbuli]
MENLIIKPNYVSLFSCIGPKCSDSCCNDWMITFDKQSYKKTISNKYLADIAKFALMETKDSESDWGVIKLDKQGACPFLNSQKLCQIHDKEGEDALSYTCKTYPKRDQIIGNDKYKSVYLSCPEVARIVLFEQEAFIFSANPSGTKSTHQPSPTWLEKSYEYSLDLLLNCGLTWQEALLAIGLLIKTSQEVSEGTASVDKLDSRYQQLQTMAQKGIISKQFEQIPYTETPQTQTFVAIHDALCTLHSRSERQRFISINDAISTLCTEENQYSIKDINKVWSEKVASSKIEADEIFTKFVIYSMFHNHFPMHEKQKPEQVFQQLVIDCFMVRCYLASVFNQNQRLSNEDIVKCFQVYHVVRQHKPKFIEIIQNILKDFNLTSIPAAISLLKTP